jgi:hypothetical protein
MLNEIYDSSNAVKNYQRYPGIYDFNTGTITKEFILLELRFFYHKSENNQEVILAIS